MTENLTRRSALRLGALGALGVAAGGIGLSRTGLPWAQPDGLTPGRPAEGLIEPQELRSSDGLLQVELTVERTRVEIAGYEVHAMTYNGTLPGPTLRVHPGDRIDLRFTNNLDEPTNLHTHGLVASPLGNSDNPFLIINPGESFDYRFDLPPDHPTGTFWYHPHLHGKVTDHLFAGLYGALIVDPHEDEVEVTRERTLVISDISFTEDGVIPEVTPPEVMMGREGQLVLVNGQYQPTLTADSGDRERWHVVNACASRFLRLDLAGQDVRVLSVDSGRETGEDSAEGLLLAPGNRAELLVTMTAGTSAFVSTGYDRGRMMGGMTGGSELSGPVVLAALDVTGSSGTTFAPLAPRSPMPDLRGREVSRRRHMSFTMGMGRMMGGGGMMHEMGFDGLSFDADRIDQEVPAGTVEEWTITNPTPMDHPFHLHVWPMQVIRDAGGEVTEPQWRDVINVPPRRSITVLIDFTPFHGLTVYHCHILDHEDAGMMGTIDVVP